MTIYPRAEPESDLPHELVAEPVVGWRAWFVDEGTGELNPLARGGYWEEVEVARCDYDHELARICAIKEPPVGHDAPHPSCSCGIWALKDRPSAVATAAQFGATCYRTIVALGRVELWGQIVESERGYRAQYARPRDLELVSLRPFGATLPAGFVELVEERYGCDARVGEDTGELERLYTARRRNFEQKLTFSVVSYQPRRPPHAARLMAAVVGVASGALAGTLAMFAVGMRPLALFALVTNALACALMTRLVLSWRRGD